MEIQKGDYLSIHPHSQKDYQATKSQEFLKWRSRSDPIFDFSVNRGIQELSTITLLVIWPITKLAIVFPYTFKPFCYDQEKDQFYLHQAFNQTLKSGFFLSSYWLMDLTYPKSAQL